MTTPLPEQAKSIIKCCRNGQLAQLKELLSEGIDFQLFDSPLFAPLNTALKHGRWQIVRYLFKENNLPLNKKTPPIIAAAQYSKDNTTGLEIVFAHTGNTEAVDTQDRTALMTAALLGHEKKLTYLIKNATNVNATDHSGMSAFLDAVVNQSLKNCDTLLKNGADPHQITAQGDNAMTLLLQNSTPNPRLIKKLLQQQLDLNHKNNHGHTSLSISQSKHPKIYKVLQAHIEAEKQMELPIFAPSNPIEVAIQPEKNTIKQRPLNEEKTPTKSYSETADDRSSNQLQDTQSKQLSVELSSWFQAATSGNLGLLNKLKIQGLTVDEVDSKGCTALIHAAGSGNRAVASFLIQNQADIEHRSHNGSTALSSAIISNSKSVVDLLIKKQANPAAIGPGKYPYITLAAAQWNAGIVSILADAGAPVNTLDPSQLNLYHNVMLAAEYYSNIIKAKDTVRVIHHLGLDINQTDKEGNTPLHILCGAHKEKAYNADDSQIANLTHELLKLGALSNLTNKKGFTALQYAKKHHLLNTKGVIYSFMS
ncbi:ankyrin repeat domain-containing protein [Marinicella rhabdoformis]|uniref:ankyrin repeat domain-containing protein n=1 Tax=Marinicella rhabdoformis TaxID=2580566 RepID=UPI0012AEB92E|nr:ankyrin repeat domain-containing protein [Marinicella rhabdoformis]